MDEKPPESNESQKSPEGLTSWEILLTPGIIIGIVGTGDGLSLPIHFKTGVPKESPASGSINPSLEQLEHDINRLPKELMMAVVEMRASDQATAAFKEKGFYRESFTFDHIEYIGLYVRSTDAHRRDGFKGIFIGWDTLDEELNTKMDKTFFRQGSTNVALDLWTTIYSNPEKVSVPSEEFIKGDYFTPPSEEVFK